VVAVVVLAGKTVVVEVAMMLQTFDSKQNSLQVVVVAVVVLAGKTAVVEVAMMLQTFDSKQNSLQVVVVAVVVLERKMVVVEVVKIFDSQEYLKLVENHVVLHYKHFLQQDSVDYFLLVYYVRQENHLQLLDFVVVLELHFESVAAVNSY
jgi:hypothetical protein